MSEKERIKPDRKNTLLFYGVTTLIILISFFLFVPKISSSLFPFKRSMLWDNFITQVQKDKKIDPQKYWEFREFYSPGYFTFDKTAQNAKVSSDLSKYDIKNPLPFITELTFHSKNLSSIDTLTTQTKLSNIIIESRINTSHPYFQDSKSGIYALDNHHVLIIFLVSEKEMEQANGFFDYRERDKELVKGKMWFNVTKLTL